jgi:hypothetical protein
MVFQAECEKRALGGNLLNLTAVMLFSCAGEWRREEYGSGTAQ